MDTSLRVEVATVARQVGISTSGGCKDPNENFVQLVNTSLIPLPELFSLAPSIPQVLIDPRPDSANRMSRLRITVSERNDLISILDRGFGEHIAKPTKGNRSAFESAGALLRQWLAMSGHTPLP
jgi:hypothetical protein